jgi:hypothetical protein
MRTTGKELHVRETAGVDRCGEYLRVAVPFAHGELQPHTPVSLVDAASQSRPAQARVLKQWPDGSVKWLLVDCQATVPAGATAVYRLVAAGKPQSVPSLVRVTSDVNAWQVDTGAGVFTVDARTFRPFALVRRKDGGAVCTEESACRFSADGSMGVAPVVEDIRLEECGPLRAIVALSGRIVSPGSGELRFAARLHFFADSMAVRIEFTIHNPRAAAHPGCLWDLGDDRSLLFRELALIFSLAPGTADQFRLAPEIGAAPTVAGLSATLSIYQESSGGSNWQNPNHRNRNGQVPQTLDGYLLTVDDRQAAAGRRASPFVWCGKDGRGIAAALPYFWQEFPRELAADRNRMKISLFPARFPDLHELQGGEQKTCLICLDFDARPEQMSWALSPLRASASPGDYRCSGIFLDLPADGDLVDLFAPAAEIMAKRERGDEYGWRSFGDIHADHEAFYHDRDQPFVSHYNNQYDFCAGAYRKFFATGDPRWEEIAADLARHVRDIDIYHTDQDREEYNRGLFWHTDHYIDAGLCSHRSYSREHLAKKEPHLCGGGPNAEHCYTTGLMLHYFQTGDPAFKEAVLDLAQWGLRSLAGSQTLLAACKRGLEYAKVWRDRQGRRLFPTYPLNRGTGNVINACLDAFEVGGGRKYLETAEKLIRHTLHPGDDIAARNLLDAERAWSYTVLLVSVAKYVDKKRELYEFDDGFNYARACLLAYAEWMLYHEYPYLEKPEILEYPNETWPAQDLRKCVIFFHASRYACAGLREAFRHSGRNLFDISRAELLGRETSRFCRPLALMLQNSWVEPRLIDEVAVVEIPDAPMRPVSGRPTPYLAFGSVACRIGSEVMRALRESSLRREVAWLKARARG